MNCRIGDPATGTACCFWILQLPWLHAFQLPNGVPECGVIYTLY
jgi:hypothetical protein